MSGPRAQNELSERGYHFRCEIVWIGPHVTILTKRKMKRGKIRTLQSKKKEKQQ